ncbi:MAG: hypothetical protein GKC07_02445 [Methanomicrobiales archaeon]|nr:hypothetical protein [Methanomicrobiales archaeon]
MRRILFFLLSAALLCGAVQGYVLSIEAPGELRAGAPLLVSGTTTFPAGTQFDIVFYKLQFTTPQEIGRRMIVVGESKEFDASFPTTGLEAGHYKVEVQFLKDPGSKLGSDSVTLQQVEIIDRSGEIFLTAPRDQVLGEALLIEGYIPDLGVATITLRISGPAGFSLPDQFVRTTTQPGKVDGWFSYKVPVTEPGNYYVEIYDREGFMATVKYAVERPAPVTTPAGTETSPSDAPTSPSAVPFPLAALAAGLAGAVVICAGRRQ